MTSRSGPDDWKEGGTATSGGESSGWEVLEGEGPALSSGSAECDMPDTQS